MMMRFLISCLILPALFIACSKSSSETATVSYETDTSSSGAVMGAAGGALTASASAGTQANFKSEKRNIWEAAADVFQPRAYASGTCPTALTLGTVATGCFHSGSSMWLTYSNCTFRGTVTWAGVQKISMSTGTATCGTFPDPGASGTLYRQF